MSAISEKPITKDEQKEIAEFISILLLIPKEDRALLLSNANAFKVRSDLERIRKEDRSESGSST